jgi:hypothetical protein
MKESEANLQTLYQIVCYIIKKESKNVIKIQKCCIIWISGVIFTLHAIETNVYEIVICMLYFCIE